MESVFLKLVNMSITASYFVLAVILFRLVLRKAPKYIRCILWGLVALRLICPFSIESIFSLIPNEEPLSEEFLYAATPRLNTGIVYVNNAINPVIAESLTPVGMTSANPTQIWSFILSRVWVIGMAVMALYALISYLRLLRQVRVSISMGKNIRLCDHISSPFILGILRPKIYLPSDISQETADHVLSHEMAHLARKDHWWKPLGYLLLSVYWFNPVIWVAYILLCRDIELACDERVARDLNTEEKKAYSSALLQCSMPRHMIAACPLAFGEVGVKSRIKSVLNYKKPAFWVIAVAVIAAIIVGVCFLTDPAESSSVEISDDIAGINDITNENGYTILKQATKNIDITIPKSALPDSIYSEEGHTFGVNEIVVYETDTTVFYLDSVRFANEGEDMLYFKFNTAYTLPEAGTITLLNAPDNEEASKLQLWVTYRSVLDERKEYKSAVSIRGVDSGMSFTVYVNTEVCRQASKYLSFRVDNFTDLTYCPEGYDAVDAALVIEERLPVGSYVCSDCVYWPLYSSTLRPNTGPYNFLVYEDSISYYSSGSGNVLEEHPVDWQWKPLAQCYEDVFFYIEWYEGFVSELNLDVPIPREDTLYQKLDDEHMLIKSDGVVYMVEGKDKGDNHALTYVDAIYRAGRIELTGSNTPAASRDEITVEIVDSEHHSNGVSLYADIIFPERINVSDDPDALSTLSAKLIYTSARSQAEIPVSHFLTEPQDRASNTIRCHFVFNLQEQAPTEDQFTLELEFQQLEEPLTLSWEADVDDAKVYTAKSGDMEYSMTVSPYVINVEALNSGYDTTDDLFRSILIWGKDGTLMPITGNGHGGSSGNNLIRLQITLDEPLDIDNIRTVKVGGLNLNEAEKR